MTASPSIAQARWIWSAEATHDRRRAAPVGPYEVRRFRRDFELVDPAGCRLEVQVSADSRYLLWCNGRLAARGPAKGDIHHHFYETVDLTPYLRAGRNALAALVLDMSEVAHRPTDLGAPCSVMTYAGGFVLGGAVLAADGAVLADLATGPEWRVAVDTAHRFQNDGTRFEGYHGYFEHRVSAEEPAGWREPDFDDSGWAAATVLYRAELHPERRDPASPYGLLPRIIPLLEEGEPRPFADVFAPGGGEPPAGFRRGEPVRVPAGERLRLIFDAGASTTAFPRLRLAAAPGARVRLTYAEALRLPWDTPEARMLGRRQSLANLASHYADESTGWTFDRRGEIAGWSDRWEPAGAGEEVFEPLHWRSFRYVGLDLEAGPAGPLELREFTQRFTAYPYEVRGAFHCSDPRLDAMWDVSVRTMRLCSHETFEDCVHYEQMQYAGDTMITSKLAMLATGDYRLSRQALLHFEWSRLPEGLTQSRYPSRLLQVIPSWSLHWITNLRDYLLCSGDAGTAADLLPGVRAVLDWFRRHGDTDGLPARLPFWNTADWCPWWQRGQPPGWDTGPTCVIAAQYIVALDEAAWLHEQLGRPAEAAALATEAAALRPRLHVRFWSESEGLYFDRPGGPEVSQYGNAWAVVAGAADAATRERLRRRFPGDPALAPVSFFGWHTIFTALEKCGAYDTMPRWLGPWDDMLAQGLTTWAEENSYWRSLCHAWTAHPALDFLTRVVGVRPLAPGFRYTVIAPQPCGLDHARGTVCTPHGPVAVAWRREGKQLVVEVEAPSEIQLLLVAPDGSSTERTGGSFSSRLDLPA